MAEPIKMDALQYYWDIGVSPTKNFVRVTEDTSFNPASPRDKYSPKYKCNKVQPSYSAGKTYSFSVDIDIVENQPFQEWLMDNEDNDNVPTHIVRVWATQGTPEARPAKMSGFAWNGEPLDGEANSPIKIAGVLDMVDDGWVQGTFDEGTLTFTAVS